ncbi:hypothetical protein ADUPG1_009734, partial [Aduncisulcus paluster]
KEREDKLNTLEKQREDAQESDRQKEDSFNSKLAEDNKKWESLLEKVKSAEETENKKVSAQKKKFEAERAAEAEADKKRLEEEENARLARLKANADKAKQRQEEAEAFRKELENIKKTREQNREEKKKKEEEEDKKLEGELSRLIAELEVEIHVKEEELSKKLSDNEEKRKLFEQLKAEFERVEKIAEEAEQSSLKVSRAADAITKQLGDKADELEANRKISKSTKEDQENVEDRLDKVERKVVMLRGKQADDDRIEKCKTQISELSSEYATLKERIDAFLAIVNTKREEVAALRAEKNSLYEKALKLKDDTARMGEIKEEKKKMEEEVRHLERKLERSKAKVQLAHQALEKERLARKRFHNQLFEMRGHPKIVYACNIPNNDVAACPDMCTVVVAGGERECVLDGVVDFEHVKREELVKANGDASEEPRALGDAYSAIPTDGKTLSLAAKCKSAAYNALTGFTSTIALWSMPGSEKISESLFFSPSTDDGLIPSLLTILFKKMASLKVCKFRVVGCALIEDETDNTFSCAITGNKCGVYKDVNSVQQVSGAKIMNIEGPDSVKELLGPVQAKYRSSKGQCGAVVYLQILNEHVKERKLYTGGITFAYLPSPATSRGQLIEKSLVTIAKKSNELTNDGKRELNAALSTHPDLSPLYTASGLLRLLKGAFGGNDKPCFVIVGSKTDDIEGGKKAIRKDMEIVDNLRSVVCKTVQNVDTKKTIILKRKIGKVLSAISLKDPEGELGPLESSSSSPSSEDEDEK